MQRIGITGELIHSEQRLRDSAREQRVPLVDMSPIYQGPNEVQFFQRSSPAHLTEQGHAAVAGAVVARWGDIAASDQPLHDAPTTALSPGFAGAEAGSATATAPVGPTSKKPP